MTDTISSWINVLDRISTWSDLAGLVEKYRANRWIFRSVDDATHSLLPGIGRPGTRKDMDTGLDLPFDEAEEINMLARFQREVRPHATTDTRAYLKHDWPGRLHLSRSGSYRQTPA